MGVANVESVRKELRRKFDLTFEGLINIVNLDKIWSKSCKAQPDLAQLYKYAEEVAFEFFEGFEDENSYQDSDVSDSNSLGDGEEVEEHESVERISGQEGERVPLLLSGDHVMNGVPSEMVPEDVLWTGKEWICIGVERVRAYSARQLRRYEARKTHVARYPCQSVNILYTHEFDEILEVAGFSSRDLENLNTRMSILRWIHEINTEVANEWGNQFTSDSNELSIVWIVMGYKLLEKKLSGPMSSHRREQLPRGYATAVSGAHLGRG